jgi:hypothetical protein
MAYSDPSRDKEVVSWKRRIAESGLTEQMQKNSNAEHHG